MKLFKNLKNKSDGFGHHIVLPIMVIAVISLIGVRVMLASHAAQLPRPTFLSDGVQDYPPNPAVDSNSNADNLNYNSALLANPNLVNIPPNPNFELSCNWTINDNSTTCLNAAKEAINNARKIEDNLGPLPLSIGEFEKFNIQQQTFIISNLERVTRGIPADVALTDQLDGIAQYGANIGDDPNTNIPNWKLTGNVQATGASGNLAVVGVNPLVADYEYMYNDASSNWGHRANILSNNTSPYYPCPGEVDYSGTGYKPATTNTGTAFTNYTDYTQIFVGGCGIPTDEVFAWPVALRVLNGEKPLSGPSTLDAGQSMKPGTYLLSNSNDYQLDYQTDGNIVIYNMADQHIWDSNTGGTTPDRLAMQTDGNLVDYGPANKVLWQAHTQGKNHLVMQGDGNLVIYNSAGTAVWDYSKGNL